MNGLFNIRLPTRWVRYHLLGSLLLALILVGLLAVFSPHVQQYPRLVCLLFGVAALAGLNLVSRFLWRRHARQLGDATDTVMAMTRGSCEARLPEDDLSEFGELCRQLNWLSQRLQERQTAEHRRWQEQQAVLSSMREGVLAIDETERIISLNRVAQELLNAEDLDVAGCSISEVVRQPDLEAIIHAAITENTPLQEDVSLRGSPRRHLVVRSSPIRGPTQERVGTLFVFNDRTEMRRLERVRQDFVANVSHELRTPITSIKGFLETLLDVPPDDAAERQRFLEIIAKQADRLDAIIEDLLSLSRLEQESEHGSLEMKRGSLLHAVLASVRVSQSRADSRGVRIEVEVPESLEAEMNAPLIEQAVSNLIDNAIKYGGENKTVRVRAGEDGDGLFIAVTDEGAGIPEAQQEKIFHRFYRVDKSRSRHLGGTGLGLSIVKHIALAHGGSIGCSSSLGKGSTFTIRLPGHGTKK